MMGYAVVAETEYNHGKPGPSVPYRDYRKPGARTAKYRKQLQRDGVQFLEEHHPPGRLEGYPDSTVAVFTWAD